MKIYNSNPNSLESNGSRRFTQFLREEIERSLSDIADTKRTQGNDYDPNSYGAGYDEGEINGIRLALAILEDEK